MLFGTLLAASQLMSVQAHPLFRCEDVKARVNAVNFRTCAVRERALAPGRDQPSGQTVHKKIPAETATRKWDLSGLGSASPRTDSVPNCPGTAPLNRQFSVETQGFECGWRPEPESNRRARICSPLRNHSAIGPKERGGALVASFALGSSPCGRSAAVDLGSCGSPRKLHCRPSFDERRLARAVAADMSALHYPFTTPCGCDVGVGRTSLELQVY